MIIAGISLRFIFLSIVQTMVRKFQGPLQIGKRSAKVPKNMPRVPRITSKFKAASFNKAVAQSVKKNMTGETKLKALVTHIDSPPISQDTGGVSPVYYKNYCLGVTPSNYTNFLTLGGFFFPQGTGNNDRIGRYMYLKKTTLFLNVGLNDPNRTSGPTRFRVIVYKARRNNAPQQPLADPGDNLLIDDIGNTFGMNTVINQTQVAFQVQHALPNKRNYHIIKDKQFLLTPPTTQVQGGSNLVTSSSQGQLNEKNMTLNLGHWKKVAFGDDNTPNDLNYTYCVSIFSMPVGRHSSITGNWSSSTRGTVSASE